MSKTLDKKFSSSNEGSLISPNDYTRIFLKDSVSLDVLQKMYNKMFQDGLRYGNDSLAYEGLSNLVSYIEKKQEVKIESCDGGIKHLWDKETNEEDFSRTDKILSIFTWVVTSTNFYCDVTPRNAPDYGDLEYGIALSKTWEYILAETASLLYSNSPTSHRKENPSQENVKAFSFLSGLYTKQFFKEIKRKKDLRIRPLEWNVLVFKSCEEVLTCLKNSVNRMHLIDVIFWLENHGKTMPIEFLNIFRIEFVRKGGSLDMDTTKKNM